MKTNVYRMLPVLLTVCAVSLAAWTQTASCAEARPGPGSKSLEVGVRADAEERFGTVEDVMVEITPGPALRERIVISQASPQNDRGSGVRRPPAPDDPKVLQWMFKNMREYLKLDDEQSKRFEPIFLEYVKTRGKLMKEHGTLLRRIMADSDNESVAVKDLQSLSSQYKAMGRQLWQQREGFYKKSAEVLNERQVVKLVIYEDKVKEELFHRMRRDRGSDGVRKGGDSSRPSESK